MSKDDVNPSDYAFLEGRILRVESEQRAIRRIHGELTEEVEKLTLAVRNLREEGAHLEPWRETTDVRNMRRVEMESLRSRARDAENAETALVEQKTRFTRQLVLLVPAFGAVLYAVAEVIRSFLHH
jgi:hypothetical protein